MVLIRGMGIPPLMVTFKRQLALDIGGHKWREVLPMGEDTDFFIRLMARSHQ